MTKLFHFDVIYFIQMIYSNSHKKKLLIPKCNLPNLTIITRFVITRANTRDAICESVLTNSYCAHEIIPSIFNSSWYFAYLCLCLDCFSGDILPWHCNFVLDWWVLISPKYVLLFICYPFFF